MSPSTSKGHLMSMLPNSCLFSLFTPNLYFHDDKYVTREITGCGEGRFPERSYHRVRLVFMSVWCLKAATERLVCI